MKDENTPPIPPEAKYIAQANEIKRFGGDLCIRIFVKRYWHDST